MPRSRTLFTSDEFTVGEFHCPPDDPAWSRENSVGPGRHVVFPGTGVLIAQDGRDPVVADPNHAVLYEDHQTYRRQLVSARGDHCVFVIPSPALLLQLAGCHVADVRFSTPCTPADGRAFLLQHQAVRHSGAPRIRTRTSCVSASTRCCAGYSAGCSPPRAVQAREHRSG